MDEKDIKEIECERCGGLFPEDQIIGGYCEQCDIELDEEAEYDEDDFEDEDEDEEYDEDEYDWEGDWAYPETDDCEEDNEIDEN